MRNQINSSIANVIGRCNAAVDMLRGLQDFTGYLQHIQLCGMVTNPAGDLSKSCHVRLLTAVGTASNGIGKPLSRHSAEILRESFEWLFSETTGHKLQPCMANASSSVSTKVS